MNWVEQRIYDQIVATCLSGDERGFDHGTDLQGTGVLDSFSTLSLVAFIDDTFGVQLDAVDINSANFRSVASIAELVVNRLPGAT